MNAQTQTTASQKNRPILFYDGGCPLCRLEIAHYRRLDRRAEIEWVDIHAHPDLLQPYGVSWGNAMQRIHLLDGNGRMITGAYAFAALWRRLPYYRVLAAVTQLPGVLWLLEKAYVPFARWRWHRRCGDVCGSSRIESVGQQAMDSTTHTETRQ